jgi:hypothetical protein
MSQHRSRIAGLLALLAVLVLAPTAVAAAPSQLENATGKAKERAFGKHCGSPRKASVRSGERGKCLDALSKLATGKSSSPRKACRALSRKKGKGVRTSAYARCVKAGKKLVKTKGRAGGGGSAGAGAGDNGEDFDPEGDGSEDEDTGAGTAPGGGRDDPDDEPEDDSDPADAINDEAPED